MNITLRYTARNIKCNKLRVWMISLSTLISSLVFFFAFIFPTIVTTVQKDTMKTFYGSADIYVMPDIAELQNVLDSDASPVDLALYTGRIQMRKLRENEDVMKLLDYAVSTFAIPGNIDNNDAYIIFANLEDFGKFNPINYSQRDEEKTANGKLALDSVVISKAYADEKGLSVGDETKIFIPLCGERKCTVAAISENTGLFSPINKELVILPKESARYYLNVLGAGFIGVGMTSDVEYFDLALIKVKDHVDVGYATEKVKEVFKGLSVNRTIDLDLIGETVDSIMPLFVIGLLITCLFCGFILYFISNALVKDRTTEFARMRSMGARIPSLIISLLMENFFYAFIGSLFGVGISSLVLYFTMPNVLPAIKIMHFIYPILLSIALSFIGIALQFGRFFKTIKQSLVNSDKMNALKKWIIALFIIANIGSFIFVLCMPRGWKTTSLIIYCLLILTSVYLAPVYFRVFCWIVNKIFRIKTFTSMYIKNSTHTSHTPWLIRAIAFGAITVTLLSVMNTTFQNSMAESNEHIGYNIEITGLIGTSTPTTFRNIDGVEKSYPVTKLQNVKVDDLTRNTALIALSDADAKALLSTYCDKETLNRLDIEGGILVGNYFRDILGYKQGDVVTLNLNNTEKGTKEFVIVGFVSGEKYAKNIIADIHEINYLTDTKNCTNIYIQAKEDKIESVIDYAKTRCLLIENVSRTTNKTTAMFDSIFTVILVLISAIIIMCVVSNFMCFVIFLREIRKNCFTFNSMGLTSASLSQLLSSQLLAYAFVGGVFSLFLLFPLLSQSANLMGACNLTMTITISFTQVLLVLLAYCVVYILLSWIFVPIISQKLIKREYTFIKLNRK